MKLETNALYILNNYKSDYRFSYDKVNELDKLTQDLLHKLELKKTTYQEKAKIAVELSHVRQDRRYYKNVVECYQGLVNMESKVRIEELTLELNKAVNKMLSLKRRRYTPRIEKIVLNKKQTKI